MTEPLRHGQPWDETDYEQFVTALRDGLVDEEVASVVGRSVGSLRSRAGFLLRPLSEEEKPSKRPVALNLLRDRLIEEPEYDWMAHVRDSHQKRSLPAVGPRSRYAHRLVMG